MFTLGKVLISTRGLALGNYHFYMNAKPSVAMVQGEMCQCPLGLIPHFYMVSTTDTKGSVCHVSMPSRAYTSFLPDSEVIFVLFYFCVSMPSRAYTSFLPYDEGSGFRKGIGVNALSGLYLISTRSWCYQSTMISTVSMPSRAYTSFLRSPFKNLDFMRFPEPVFAGIYQNILTTAVFHAC